VRTAERLSLSSVAEEHAVREDQEELEEGWRRAQEDAEMVMEEEQSQVEEMSHVEAAMSTVET
jgi:vacuolar-type H+-ATPase subunit H